MPKDRCLISGISGSLAHWKEGVAKAAMASTYLSFTIMVAFAAPLMRFSKLSEGAIFNLSCSSTSGKTTATQCAQSVFGTPDAFADWNSTSISLEELAAAYNDLLFVLDDTEKAKKADITELLDKAAHILPDGRPRNYSRFYAGHNKARALRWRCIGLSSSPKSIDDLYAERGTERSLGQRVRLIDLPIPANPHLGLFDHVTGDGAQLEKKLRKTIRAMDSALDKNFGKAVPPWIEFIRSSKAETRVPDLITKFVRHAAQSSGAAESRVAAKFGLVYAAGMMALEAKILPWPEEWVLSTILKCFNLARSKLPKNGNETAVKKAGLASLLTNAKSIPTLDVTKPLSRKEEKESIGFRFSKGGAKVVGLKRDSLKTFCGSEAGVKSLLKSFVSQKICLGNGGVPRAIQVRVHVAVKYPTGRTKNEEIKRRVVLLDARAVDQLLARAEKPLLAKTTAAKTVTKATA